MAPFGPWGPGTPPGPCSPGGPCRPFSPSRPSLPCWERKGNRTEMYQLLIKLLEHFLINWSSTDMIHYIMHAVIILTDGPAMYQLLMKLLEHFLINWSSTDMIHYIMHTVIILTDGPAPPGFPGKPLGPSGP